MLLPPVLFSLLQARPAGTAGCGAIQAPWPVPTGDDDCDGWATGDPSHGEQHVGTAEFALCPATGGFSAGRNDEFPDAWPPDFDDNQLVNIQDLASFIAPVRRVNTSPGEPGFDTVQDGYNGQRWDLAPGSFGEVINIQDMAAVVAPMRFGRCTITPAAPGASVSRYMTTTDSTTLRNEGCAQGDAAPDDAVVVLDFGQPQWDGSTYGTLLFDSVTFASIGQIEEATKDFLRGYWNCTGDTPWKHVTLVIGTNNYYGYTGFGHGQARAQMVNRVNQWIDSPPSYRSREEAVGGSDMETGWGSGEVSRAWADGYDSANSWPYYNYGDAGGCPLRESDNRPCNGGWRQDDVWYVSWGAAPAWPLPEIYRTDGALAAQWHALAVYSLDKSFGLMRFKGTLTQWQACSDQGSDWCSANGVDNRPQGGWSQLWVQLNADLRTAQDPPWCTDITWQS